MCLLTGAGNAHLIASYNDNLLSRKKFLSHYTSETTKKVIMPLKEDISTSRS